MNTDLNQGIAKHSFSRRGFLGIAAAAASVPLLAACGITTSGGSGGNTIKFWDMPWGDANYNDAAQKLVGSYAPSSNLPGGSYQLIQWDNFYQTFSSAIASKTGPAVSTGGGFQAFQFADQGAIAYADNLVATLKQNGQFDDFLPGTLEPFKTDKGYVAIPWALDMRVFWYRKSLLDQAGAPVPTDWDSLLAAGKALKKIGVFGFGTGAGAGNNLGNHAMVTMMLNNGGGLYDPDGKPDCVTDRNIEAMDFVRELAGEGIIDPAAVSYSEDNMRAQWKNNQTGLGWDSPGLPERVGDDSGDILVTDPLVGPHGDKATLVLTPNIMMYTNTPSQAGSEAFVAWYLGNIKTLWQQNVVPMLPVFNSIVQTPEFQANKQNVKIVSEWQPVAKTFATQSDHLFGSLAAVDGGQGITQFTQTMLLGKTDSKTALATLQQSIESVSS